jgi:hypothetical protein
VTASGNVSLKEIRVDLPSTLLQEYQMIDVLVPSLWSIIRSGQHDNSLSDT